MTPAKIIRANLWVDPSIGVPHDDRHVIAYRKGRSPSKFIAWFENSKWYRDSYQTEVQRWRDLPDDPVEPAAPDALVDKPISFGLNKSHKKFKYFNDGTSVWRHCNCEKGTDH